MILDCKNIEVRKSKFEEKAISFYLFKVKKIHDDSVKNKSARAKQLEGVEAPIPPPPPARLSRVKSTIVNRALSYLQEGSLGIMLTVPLI